MYMKIMQSWEYNNHLNFQVLVLVSVENFILKNNLRRLFER